MRKFWHTQEAYSVLDQPVVVRENKRAKRLTLRVAGSDGQIRLTVPPRTRPKKIEEFLNAHKDWINKHISKIPDRVVFDDDALVPFLGIPHHICHIDTDRGVHVWIDDRNLIMAECPAARLPRAIERFLKQQAHQEISPLAHEKAALIGKTINKIGIRDPKGRWGSCNSDGNLSFSWRLIMAPYHVLDYLVAHEAAHLEHLNHSKDFWKCCANLSEDMAGAKSWLRRYGNDLHRYG